MRALNPNMIIKSISNQVAHPYTYAFICRSFYKSCYLCSPYLHTVLNWHWYINSYHHYIIWYTHLNFCRITALFCSIYILFQNYISMYTFSSFFHCTTENMFQTRMIIAYSWWRHQRKHFLRYWTFVRVIYRSSVRSPHNGQWRGALVYSLICAWTNGWVNSRDAGDLWRHRAYYDVTVMMNQYEYIACVLLLILDGMLLPRKFE